jgi:hypothetical protein
VILDFNLMKGAPSRESMFCWNVVLIWLGTHLTIGGKRFQAQHYIFLK